MFMSESLLVDVIYITAIILFSILTYFYYCFLYWQQKQTPYIPASFPFGNIKDLVLGRKSIGGTMLDIYSQFRDTGCKYGGFYMLMKPSFMILDPELIKQILTKDFEYFQDRSASANEKDDPLSGHLFATTGTKWKSLRKKITPTFTSGKMKMMFKTLLACAEELEETLQEPIRTSVPINIKDLLGRYMTDVIGSCVFGLNCNSLKDPNTEFYHYAKLFVNSTLSSSIKFMLTTMFGKILNILKIRRIDKEVSDFYFNILKSTIQYREENKVHRNDFVELFIKLKNNESIDDDNDVATNRHKNSKDDMSDTITFNELAAQAFIFFIAGYESSSTTLSFCLYELSLQPHIQDKLRMEILTILNKHNGEITYNAILEMEYLDKVVKETLRKYPSAPALNRKCTQDYKIPGSDIILKKGTPVWVSIFGLHTDPRYYTEPEKFDPERFGNQIERVAFTYLPFGEGPRNCIGARFGMLQIKVALVVLLKGHTFSLDPQTKTPLELSNNGFLLAPRHDIWLRIKTA